VLDGHAAAVDLDQRGGQRRVDDVAQPGDHPRAGGEADILRDRVGRRGLGGDVPAVDGERRPAVGRARVDHHHHVVGRPLGDRGAGRAVPGGRARRRRGGGRDDRLGPGGRHRHGAGAPVAVVTPLERDGAGQHDADHGQDGEAGGEAP
jgi:hypothetical protein